MNFWGHLTTINRHKMLVMKHCFRLGLYKQGLLHDLSKYSPVEFFAGCMYYQGTGSPTYSERMTKGYSAAWLHHKGRNKHHYEYWIDYSLDGDTALTGMKIPVCYVVEMFVDRMCACKNYQKEKYSDNSPLDYYNKGKKFYVMHPETQELLERLLKMLAEKGEDETFSYIRQHVLKN